KDSTNVPRAAAIIRAESDRMSRHLRKHIAHTPHGSDDHRLSFELLAKVAHVDIDRPLVRRRLTMMEYARDLIARHDPSRGVDQQFEQLKLGRRQLNRCGAGPRLIRLSIEPQASRFQ